MWVSVCVCVCVGSVCVCVCVCGCVCVIFFSHTICSFNFECDFSLSKCYMPPFLLPADCEASWGVVGGGGEGGEGGDFRTGF